MATTAAKQNGDNQYPGRAFRRVVPRSSHADWTPGPDRADPVDLITSQNDDRLQSLVPIRHWRMSESPFTFYRGAAKLMANDLATTPSTGITAQICGDAHLSNFGAYGSPERELVFDVNDFDETLPGPWEWDVKRLAASFAIAARHNEFDQEDEASLASAAAAAYRRAMAQFAEMRYLDAWYSHLTVDEINTAFADQYTKKEQKSTKKFARKARKKDSLAVANKLVETVDGEYRIAAQPPLIIPLRDIAAEENPERIRDVVHTSWMAYLESVPDHLESLLRRFRFVDMALKVVGVGSVGTRSFIVLLEGKDADDPFFLQIKEAGTSVLEDCLPPSRYANHGQRVTVGQRQMQAASDSFLGFIPGDSAGRDYYLRQLKDMKASPDVDSASPAQMERFAQICGWTLARAHARSGVAASIADYLGSGTVFDQAIGDFAIAYADQNERDYEAFMAAISSGRIDATPDQD
jgi:uncharacterized protein (DUF2252 family)